MITVQITPDTPSHMLRAIRAACNELLGESHADLTTQAAEHVTRANELQAAADAEAHKAAGALSAHNLASGGPVGAGQFYRVGEQPSEQTVTVTVENTENVSASAVAAAVTGELDSAGQPWNAELHASTKSKNADGTWKKRRGAAVPDAPPVPPAPAAPTAEPIMPKIFALITSQIVTINQAVEAAQAEGYADLGANGLGGAPREAQEAVLRKLEGA